jgi:hypothetical protein
MDLRGRNTSLGPIPKTQASQGHNLDLEYGLPQKRKQNKHCQLHKETNLRLGTSPCSKT